MAATHRPEGDAGEGSTLGVAFFAYENKKQLCISRGFLVWLTDKGGQQNTIVLAASRGYLITLSARYSTDWGIVRPICLAVLRLIASSNFVGVSTGKSCG